MVIILILLVLILVFLLFGKIKQTFTNPCHLDNDEDVFVYDTGKEGKTLLFIGGIHGNEKCGSIFLKRMIERKEYMKVKTGKVVIIPIANKCGYKENKRHSENEDINRHFPSVPGVEKIEHPIAQLILKYVVEADFIVDIHEGHDYHLKNRNSIGSTISTGGTELSRRKAEKIVGKLNEGIADEEKKFSVLEHSKNSKYYYENLIIEGTLDYYCYLNEKEYLLVEITGQNSGHKMENRLKQLEVIFSEIL